MTIPRHELAHTHRWRSKIAKTQCRLDIGVPTQAKSNLSANRDEQSQNRDEESRKPKQAHRRHTHTIRVKLARSARRSSLANSSGDYSSQAYTQHHVITSTHHHIATATITARDMCGLTEKTYQRLSPLDLVNAISGQTPG